MKEPNRIVAVRLDEQMYSKVEDFAQTVNLVTDTGAPNISAAIRSLISLGLGESLSMIDNTIWKSARGHALHEIAEKIHEVLQDYRDKV